MIVRGLPGIALAATEAARQAARAFATAKSDHRERTAEFRKLDGMATGYLEFARTFQLALPKLAKRPCVRCETTLAAAIAAGEGDVTLGDLVVQTRLLHHYYRAN